MGKPAKRKGGAALHDIKGVLSLVDDVNGLEQEMLQAGSLEDITAGLVDEVQAADAPEEALQERGIQARAAAAVRSAAGSTATSARRRSESAGSGSRPAKLERRAASKSRWRGTMSTPPSAWPPRTWTCA